MAEKQQQIYMVHVIRGDPDLKKTHERSMWYKMEDALKEKHEILIDELVKKLIHEFHKFSISYNPNDLAHVEAFISRCHGRVKPHLELARDELIKANNVKQKDEIAKKYAKMLYHVSHDDVVASHNEIKRDWSFEVEVSIRTVEMNKSSTIKNDFFNV